MTRLTSIEKGGFYAFPDQHLSAVASLFRPAKRGGRLLDPCAGEGVALAHLAQAWQLTPYANELDDDRVAACKTRFGAAQTVQGDLYQLKASHYSFTAAWVNPPYAWSSTGDEKRREFSMLKHALRWVQPGGYLFWIVYSHHLTLETATWLAKHSQRLDIWRLPGLHLNEYSQILAVAQVGQPAEEAGHLATALFQARQANALPELTVQATPCYEFPAPITRKQFVFLPKVIPAQTALAAVQEAGVQYQTGITTLLQPAPPPELVKPIVRPRGGQLALILAAGLFNGLVLDNGSGGRMAVRSTVEAVEQLVHSSQAADDGGDDETSIEREVYRTQSQVTITLLGEQGSVQDLSGDAALAAFIQQHKPALLHYLDEHFQPLYTFDYSPYRAVLARVKGGKLFQTQRHVIAACCTALQQRKQVILVGEMGVGKSICGASVAVALQPQMQPGQVVLVLCPPHVRRVGAN